jgi:transcriptional regulator with XRE-family HTH domain
MIKGKKEAKYFLDTDKLRRIFEEKNMSDVQVASKAGLSKTTVLNVKLGRVEGLTLDTAIRMCIAAGIDVSNCITETKPFREPTAEDIRAENARRIRHLKSYD